MKLIDFRYRLMLVILAIAAVAVQVALYRGNAKCHASGGHYVRGLYWMECVR